MEEVQAPEKAKNNKKSKTEQPEKVDAAPAKWQPTYQSAVEFDSHLFKLQTAKMIKNTSWNKDAPELHSVDHQHFFHTKDSSGKNMEHSTAQGGHFHIMTLTVDPVTGEPKAVCSGPKKYIQKKGKRFIVDLPEYEQYDDEGNKVRDRHTHEVVYERSSLIKPRKVNAESVKIESAEAAKTQKIPGIRS